MIVAFYNILNSGYNLSVGVPELRIDYNNPITIKEMDFIPGIKSVIEINYALYTVYGAEVIRYDNVGEETILYACHVEEEQSYPTMTLPYSEQFNTMYNSVLRKKKIRGILD